ncbi:unnamed protein product [Urochloa decumbens]|uniref:Receptor kinase-like protein Xa21 n=1 Tax=Urochloa decumbens TaxID=240449 RepID=A0ABC9B0L9_9POAL
MKITAIGKFLLVFIVFFNASVGMGSSNGIDMDKMPLLEFKRAITLDPQQALISWNDSNHLCHWQGVYCRIKNPRRVTSLDLANQGLVGQISPSLGNITFLKYIILAANRFSGEIPSSLGHLHHLQALRLTGNMLHGTIPSFTNCSVLRFLWLDRNNLVGHFPADLPHRLQQLKISYNNITGFIPPSLANITTLSKLSCVTNNIQGKIPQEFAKLPLKILYIGGNKFIGGFPQAILNFSNLVGLNIAFNHLRGDIPSSIGNSLPNLTVLQLGASPGLCQGLDNNRFNGVIPEWVGTLKGLQAWEALKCSVHSAFPVTIFREGYLRKSLIPTIMLIELSFNNLDGKLPTEVGNAKQLIYLGLSSNKLSGDVPGTLGNCESLEFVELDLNYFSGSIPTLLSNIRSLKDLNLSHNNLTGSIPASLSNLKLLQQLDLSFNRLNGEVPTEGIFVKIDGNSGLCGGVLELLLLACSTVPLNSTKHRKSIVLKVVIPLASLLSLATIISIILIQRGQQKRKSAFLPSLGYIFPEVSYFDLARATDGFSASRLVGRGRYSSVYQGELLQDRKTVAIKVFSLGTVGAHKSFIAECNALRNVRHRNLVPIITACSSIDSIGNDFKALVYEFMPRGDLHALLHLTRDDENNSTLSCITLAQRLSIVVDVADALEYLHHNNIVSIVHCDLKPSNILLDNNMTAHVGDFSLARFVVDSAAPYLGDSISTSSVAIKGTIGYVAPGGNISSLGDVYSFGIVLLELFLRKRPTDDMFNDELNIVKFVEMNFPGMVSEIADPELLKEHCYLSQEASVDMKARILNCLISVLNIGLQCTKPSPNQRMCMQEVAARLHGIKDAYLSRK